MSLGLNLQMGNGNRITLPPGYVMLMKEVDGVMIDIVGLSISELYPLIDPALRTIISADGGSSRRADVDIVTLALASPLLNLRTIIGNANIVVFYAVGTDWRVLEKALRYCNSELYGFRPASAEYFLSDAGEPILEVLDNCLEDFIGAFTDNNQAWVI